MKVCESIVHRPINEYLTPRNPNYTIYQTPKYSVQPSSSSTLYPQILPLSSQQMLSTLIKKSPRLLYLPRFLSSDSKTYVPIRALKDQRNVLFNSGQPVPVSRLYRLLVFTPMLAFTLEALVYEWNWWNFAGFVLGTYLGLRWNSLLIYNRALLCYEIAVNKNLTKFEFFVINNWITQVWEAALLKAQNKTFEQRFKQRLAKGTLNMSEEKIEGLKKLSDEKLAREIGYLYKKRKGIHLQLSASQISSWEFVSQKKLVELIKQHHRDMSGRASSKVLEDYSTETDQRRLLVVHSKKIEGQRILLYTYLGRNLEKKYEEYLKALGEGKEIAVI